MSSDTTLPHVASKAFSAQCAPLQVRPGLDTAGQQHSARAVVLRTAGRRHGSITRLVSPGDLGQILKPFVFLDYFESKDAAALQFSMHPHSGLATTTVLLQGEVEYEDTTGSSGVLPVGGVEWMNAGSGVWHGGGARGNGPVRGYQLWTALPPALELGSPASQYLPASDIPRTGPATVILGRYGEAESPVLAPPGINYLLVRLRAGEPWQYTPPAGHSVAWLSVQRGALRVGNARVTEELVVFDESEDAVTLTASEDSEFVLGSAIAHPHPLVLGHYSVHTSADALRAGEARIREIGAQLRSAGRFG
ncbi:pirin family protein [Paraburkholderia acidiphila]|uniref:Pirin family protein n=1 Tax=Paraburkholderia acidiphila TaxID=2571747 RepID=A0A7Z2G975_9BURK|nr:pirin family protein [Paraburkholderia acidiphila]